MELLAGTRLISSCAFSAFSDECGSFITSIGALRGKATRSAGTLGSASNGRPISVAPIRR